MWDAEKVFYKVGKRSKTKRSAPAKSPKTTSVTSTAEVIKFKFPARPSDRHVEYPTDFTRITPFRTIPSGKKRKYTREILFRNKFGYVKFTGQELGIDDEDVFITILDMASDQLKGNKKVITVTFHFREFLRKLKRSIGGSEVKWLNKSL